MGISANLCTLAVLAVGMCLIAPAFSAPVPSRIYIVRHLQYATEKNFLVGVEMSVNENGDESFTNVFGIIDDLWESFVESSVEDKSIVREVSVEQLPVVGLYQLLKYKPELYSDFLPNLLTNSSLKEVAVNLPVDLFKTLTPEAKKKISVEDLAELNKLYGL